MARKRDFDEYYKAFRDATALVEFSDNHLETAVAIARTMKREIDSLVEKERDLGISRTRLRLVLQRLRLSASFYGFVEGYRAATGVDLKSFATGSAGDVTPYS